MLDASAKARSILKLAPELLLGTGLLGGFTTYSTLATETAVLLTADQLGSALAYALGTLTLGAGATVLGIAIATLEHRRNTAKAGAAE